jgi:hypothetical protein
MFFFLRDSLNFQLRRLLLNLRILPRPWKSLGSKRLNNIAKQAQGQARKIERKELQGVAGMMHRVESHEV